MQHWRVFYTMPRAEKACERRLVAQGIEVLLPKHIVIRQWKDRKKKIEEPLFKNYIFAHVDEKERLEVLQSNGIVKSIFFNGELAALRKQEVEQLKIAQCYPYHLSLYSGPQYQQGDLIRVTDGPLNGLEGEVIQSHDQLQVIVLIGTIKQAFRLVIPSSWIEKKFEPYQHAA